MAILCEHYHWQPNFWLAPGMSLATHTGQMGWREFLGFLHERAESVRVQREGNKTSPDSWDGRESDPFWQGQR